MVAVEVAAWGRWSGFAPEAAILVFWGLVIGAIPISMWVHRLTRPFATVLPAADLRGLIPMIVTANVGTFRLNNPHGWTSREVWEALVSIICTQLGVSPDMLTESTSFVNDLGVD